MFLPRKFSTFAGSNWRLLVKGLPFDATESDLKSLFGGFKLASIEFITRRDGPSGSAYVYVSSEGEAREAKNAADGKYLGTRWASPNSPRKVQVSLDFLKIDSRIQPVYKPPSVDRFRQPSRY